MPSAEASLYQLMTQGSPNPVAEIIGGRCYPNVLPQGVLYPAVRYARISTPRSEFRTLDGKANYQSPRFQLDAYALKHSDALKLGQAIYQHLEGFKGTVNGLRIDFCSIDDEAGEFEPAVAEGGQGVHRQRLDVIIANAQ
jgi:hypothetical protein